MAEMIPHRLPSGASAGEKKVFALLQELPDEVIVYYEPVLSARYPDFVAIVPSVGVLLIEVKDWHSHSIVMADNHDVVLVSRGQTINCKHPVRQARDYQFQLMDKARAHSETRELLQGHGAHVGKFAFPFGHLVFLNNCTRQQLDERKLSDVFPPEKVLTRNEFEALPPGQIIDRIKRCFDPWWPFGRMSERQISVLRSIIHPEIVVSPTFQFGNAEPPPLAVLDIRQERNARSLGEGHRIVYGVAGSGKTVILIARARLIAQSSGKLVLILCYNVALSEYFRGVFAETSNVTCLNFHRWASQLNGVRFQDDEDEEAFGERLLERLRRGEGEAHKYDAVFIDEAQDFSKTWFLCAKLALKEPDDGDLLIVGDGSQYLYHRRQFTWKEAGVNAQGRTINTRFDLDKNYRNTREIMRIAAEFVSASGAQDDPELGLQTIRPDPDVALRSGPAPEMLEAPTLESELHIAVKKILAWREQGLKSSEIAVLYRVNTQGWVRDLVSLISKHSAVFWPQDRRGRFADPSGVYVTTMHSAKGLQWRAVLVMRCDTMPFTPETNNDGAERERLERGLMYVAMTRAEQMLAFTRSTMNGFASQIQQLIDRGASVTH
jgi:hypothetical protein